MSGMTIAERIARTEEMYEAVKKKLAEDNSSFFDALCGKKNSLSKLSGRVKFVGYLAYDIGLGSFTMKKDLGIPSGWRMYTYKKEIIDHLGLEN
jgi:hypothetical protein